MFGFSFSAKDIRQATANIVNNLPVVIVTKAAVDVVSNIPVAKVTKAAVDVVSNLPVVKVTKAAVDIVAAAATKEVVKEVVNYDSNAYTYDHTPGDPHMPLVHNLATLAELAYVVGEDNDNSLLDQFCENPTLKALDTFYRIYRFPDVDTYCFIMYDAEDVVLSFRGTMPNNMGNIKSDLDFQFRDLFSKSGARVHGGFLKALALNSHGDTPIFDLLLRDVKFFLNTRSRLWVTGHSLGGALATLFIGHLIAHEASHENFDLHKIAGLYTFGSPKVGNQSFVDLFHGLVHRGKYYRFVNDADGVPDLPPQLVGFQHAGCKVFLKAFRMTVHYNGSEKQREGSHSASDATWLLGKTILRINGGVWVMIGSKILCHGMSKYLEVIRCF